jgi:hypothetical protein
MENPYCEVSRLHASASAFSAPQTVEQSLSAQYIAEFDARAASIREEMKDRGRAAEPQALPQKIRSKKQRKLDKADSIASVSGPDWLREKDPLMEQILEGLRRDDSAT